MPQREPTKATSTIFGRSRRRECSFDGRIFLERCIWLTLLLLGWAPVVILSGCVSRAPNLSNAGAAWSITDAGLSAAARRGMTLQARDAEPFFLSPEAASALHESTELIQRASNQRIELVILDQAKLNAYTFRRKSEAVVVITTKTLQRFGGQSAVMAYVIAHEAAHHTLRHISSDAENTPQSNLGASTPEMELEADRQALVWLEQSGPGPCGALVFLRELGEKPVFRTPLFGSSHPDPEERIAQAQALLTTMNRACD